MIALFDSGGGTKGIVQRGANDLFREQGIKFGVLGGVSIGAANVAFEAMAVGNEASRLFLNLNDSKLWGSWSNKPQSAIGILRGILSLFTNRNPFLGRMKGYEKHLKKVITKEVFLRYQNDPQTPDCYVLAARSDGKPVFWNLKDHDYSGAVKRIIASGSIPLATEPVEVDGSFYWDGGLISHSPGDFILPFLKSKGVIPDKVVTHFTRPEGAKISEKNLNKMGVHEAFMQMIDIFNQNTTLEDQEDEQEFCIENNVEYLPMYTEYFSNGFYDTSKETAIKGYDIGKREALKILHRLN